MEPMFQYQCHLIKSHHSGIEKGLTQRTRDELYDEFRRLVNRINALAIIEGEAPYKNLMDKINVEMKRANLSERPDRKKKKEDDLLVPIDSDGAENKM